MVEGQRTEGQGRTGRRLVRPFWDFAYCFDCELLLGVGNWHVGGLYAAHHLT